MEGEDPSPSGANTHRGDPGDLDTAPRLSTREQLDDMVDLLTDEWRKTKVKHNNASNCSAEILAPSFDELQDFDFEEDTITKVRISTVPQLVTSKVNNLREWDRIGHPYLTDLISLVKEGLAKYPFSASIASGEVEGAKDKAAIFAGMLIELAKNRMLDEMSPKIETEKTGFHLPVVFMDQDGLMRMKSCRLQHDTDFWSFLELMDNYPQEYDLNVEAATPPWDQALQELKEMGYGGDPKLGEIEQRIASFKATNYYKVHKWVFYKTNRRISYAKPIEGERDVKMILEILANPPKDNKLACMVRAVDKDIILINDELRFFKRRIEDNLQPGKEPVAAPAQGDQGAQSNQQSDHEQLFSSNRFEDVVGPRSDDWFARNLGAKFGFMEAEDESEEEEDYKPVTNIDEE